MQGGGGAARGLLDGTVVLAPLLRGRGTPHRASWHRGPLAPAVP